MVTRLLLTLLALLTGLAAQLAPAQARSLAAREVTVEIVRTDAGLAARQASRAGPARAVFGKAADCTVLMLTAPDRCVPTVMMGIDRARE